MVPFPSFSCSTVDRMCAFLKCNSRLKGRRNAADIRQSPLHRIGVFPVIILLCCHLFLPTYGDWIDPDTPENAYSTRALTKGDDRQFQLVSMTRIGFWTYPAPLIVFVPEQVFSDEFEQDGRTFHDGNDPRWTAINKNDCKIMCVWAIVCWCKDSSTMLSVASY